jgi:hypothetical protein
MNGLIAGSLRHRRDGQIARLFGGPTVDSSGSTAREQLDVLTAEREQAARAGDEDALAFVEHKIDRLFDGMRAEPEPAEPVEPPPSFDGGVQRGFVRPAGGHETANQLFVRALQKSHDEHAGRRSVIANI